MNASSTNTKRKHVASDSDVAQFINNVHSLPPYA